MCLMFSTMLASVIYFIACHGGPADHFVTFAGELSQRGHTVQMYATGPALKKCHDRNKELTIPFSLDDMPEEEAAILLAKSCSTADAVITDVGHPFAIALQKALKNQAPQSAHLAYYDNPEAYVPGGYSSVASQVMLEAEAVLFANSHLIQALEIDLPPEKRIGLGYYPTIQAEKIGARRKNEHSAIRAELFAKYSLVDRGQKVLVYAGGNNEEYFTKAFPAFLELLGQIDLSETIVLLQQHPGAKEKNRDGKLVHAWNGKTVPFLISEFTTDDVQVVADVMLYYQTSMGPQFVLAGIPTIQVGHEVYEDILVRNGLCHTATTSDALTYALTHLEAATNETKILDGLGISPEWANHLESALEEKISLVRNQQNGH